MEYRITALQQQKNNKHRINVYLDHAFAFSLDMNAALLLYKGRVLTEEDVQQLRNEDRRRKAYQQAIRFLAIRNRSRMEMQRYLEKKGYGAELTRLTIERLVQETYINDLDFACRWIENRERSNPRGRYALRHELRQKGVDDHIIDEALMDVDEAASARRAVQKRLYRWQGLDKIDFQKKAGGFLNRRGFPSGVIRDTLEQAWEALRSDE
jgi:regulatory protein